MRRAALLLACLAPLLGGATAQAPDVTLAIEASERPGLRLTLEGARGDTDMGLSFVGAARPGVGVTWRHDRAFGALGTLVLEGGADLRMAGRGAWAQAEAGARGTVGPVAARVRLSGWNAPRPRFDPVADPRPRRGARGAAATVAVDGRPSRDWVLGGEGRVTADTDAPGVGLRMDAFARALRALPGGHHLQGSLHLERPARGRVEASAGVGATWARRRAPDWRAGVRLGVGAEGLGVGATLEGAESLGHGRRITLAVRAETFTRAPQPYRLETSLSGLGADDAWTLTGMGALDADGRPAAAARVSWRGAWPE